MKKLILAFVMAIAMAFSSCSGKKAEEMYETAEFEEVQKNYAHAKQIYQEIIEKYPESEYAKKASLRLIALNEEE